MSFQSICTYLFTNRLLFELNSVTEDNKTYMGRGWTLLAKFRYECILLKFKNITYVTGHSEIPSRVSRGGGFWSKSERDASVTVERVDKF